jgi:formylglycine-generating enzyme required for sulfatase activity
MIRARRPAGAAVYALAVALGCSPEVAPARDQWKVYLGTDAPIPQLGEQLLIELIDDSGQPTPADATQFIDASRADLWPISFGIVPDSPAAHPRIRVRLYRLEETGTDGLPGGTTLIDATASLPPAAGLTQVGLTLAMNCFAIPPDLAGHLTCDPATGARGPEPTLPPELQPQSLPAPGSWPRAAPVPCAAPVPSDMTCIPGGVFLLGSAHFAVLVSASANPVPQRLIQLRPFAIDTLEVAVGQIRPFVRSGALPAPSAPSPDPYCTFLGSDDASNDTLPINCVPWSTADQACRMAGKRLPTEAEWEYAARNLGEESTYPWGSDTSICDHAVVARADVRPGSQLFGYSQECRVTPTVTLPPGPVAVGSMAVPGSSAQDQTNRGVVSLGGNVSEWMADVFDSYSGPCWVGGGLRLSGPCEQGPSPTTHSVRGGNWLNVPASAESAIRSFADASLADSTTGFRCALSL